MTTITARPDFLTPEHAARFADAGVAEACPHRSPYAPKTYDVLASLIPGDPRDAAVLDLGSGTGDLARHLALREVVAPWAEGGTVQTESISHIIWGHPLRGHP